MELQTYLNKFNKYEELTNDIIETKIKIKECKKNPDLALLYIPFRVKITAISDIEKACRSVIIDKHTLKIVAFSYPVIFYNDYVSLTNCEITKDTRNIIECIEGTMLTFYNHNNDWLLSTRKCIDAENSFWRNSKSHMELFVECLKSDWTTFCSAHNPDYIYTYILVHHKNKQLINYNDIYGKDYKKILISLIRKKDNLEIVNSECKSSVYLNPEYFTTDNFIVSKQYNDYSLLDQINENDDQIETVAQIKNEGLLVSFYSENGKETYVKLHNNAYKIYQETSNLNYIPTSSQHYISLYQTNMLDHYFNKFSGELFYKEFQIKSLIDNMFKMLTSEMLFLFKFLWDIKFGTQKPENKDIYNDLPTEYKKFFYVLRGIYFKKKVLLNENKYITVKVVYDLLKTTPPDTILALLQERKKNVMQKSTQICIILEEYHKTEYVEKLAAVIDPSIDYCLDCQA